MINPVQEVKSDVEQLALDIANIYVDHGAKVARTMLKDLANRHKLTLEELAAVVHVATCMIHSKRWKKG